MARVKKEKVEKPEGIRTLAKHRIEEIARAFSTLLNKQVTIAFAKFSFPATLYTIELASTTAMKNKPEKRTNTDNKSYTPQVMKISTSEGTLHFVLEDIIAVDGITNGIQIATAATTVRFTLP